LCSRKVHVAAIYNMSLTPVPILNSAESAHRNVEYSC